ncbi:MAG: hypothetical protein NZM43_00940 [Saprospiraceae bacterium]|nr:hypothetical protein [Saprospiraceae bacterium]MDW8482864.1 hypothetical protein [Saprospiraceae bacterium]
MRFLFSFLVVALSLAFVITAIIYLLKRALSDVSFPAPSSASFQTVLEELRQHIKGLIPALVPWDEEMFSLLSLHQQPARQKGGPRGITSGYLMSIFQEPVVAFATRQWGKQKIVVARLVDREFVYRIKEKDAEIWLNGEPFAVFSNQALLSPDKSARVLARLEERAEERYSELVLAEGRTVSLANRKKAVGPNPRAAVLVKDLTRKEEDTALAVALLRLLA